MKSLHFLIAFLSFHLSSTLPFHQSNQLEFNSKYLDRVLLNVNASVNPCEDFYAFACGNWSSNYNETDSYLDMPGYMDYLFNNQLINALEQQYSSKQGDSDIIAPLWAYYNSCVNLKEKSLNEFLHLIEKELQFEWPIFKINQSVLWANETQFDWLGTLAKLRVYGLNGIFIKQDVNVRRVNGSHYILHLIQQQPVANQSQLIEQQVLKLYIAFGLNDTLAQNLTGKLIQLEWQVGNLTNKYQQHGNETELPEWTLEQLSERLPQLEWKYYFRSLLNRSLPDDQLIQVPQLEASYLDNLQVILNATSNETLAYYIMFKLLYLLNEELPWVEKNQNLSMACIHQLRGHMPLALNYLYEQQFYATRRNVTDTALQQMMANIQSKFEQLIQENKLNLNDQEVSYIREELNTVQLKIGNIPQQITEEQVKHYYHDLNLHPFRFFGNKLQLLKWNSRLNQQLLLNLPQPSNQNGYYHQEPAVSRNSSPVKIFQNVILLPFGYLQLPIYDVHIDKLLQYSLFGFILAHELQHAFDLFHIVYDARGNYNETGIGLAQHYVEFIDCYAKSQAEHVLLSETMSDIVGLRLTYSAYLEQRTSISFPSIGNYTEDQLFFINSVQFLCGNMQQIEAMAYSADAEHGLHNKRVNRNWAHHEHFASSFKCVPGQAMHKDKICRLW